MVIINGKDKLGIKSNFIKWTNIVEHFNKVGKYCWMKGVDIQNK